MNTQSGAGYAVIIDHHGADFTVTLQDGGHNSLAFRPASANLPLPILSVHVPRPATNEGFIHSHVAAELAASLTLHRQRDAVQHEPSGLLVTPMARWISQELMPFLAFTISHTTGSQGAHHNPFGHWLVLVDSPIIRA